MFALGWVNLKLDQFPRRVHLYGCPNGCAGSQTGYGVGGKLRCLVLADCRFKVFVKL